MNINDIIKALEVKAYPLSSGVKFNELSLSERGAANTWLEAYELIKFMTKGYCLRPISPPRGESMPQTVEHCQAVMERDQELILEMKDEISKLKQTVNTLRQRK